VGRDAGVLGWAGAGGETTRSERQWRATATYSGPC
jgi:hypothetical protein